MEFEACVESLEGALLAEQFGADRIELCSALHEGGLSPSTALVKQIKAHTEIPIYAMIRPVAGGFVYSDKHLDLMELEIVELARAGVQGVVFGVLNDDNHLDLSANARLITKAKEQGLEPVCHRAFDFTPEPSAALQQIIDLGFKRLLTSGQEPKAIDGIECIKRLHHEAQGKIEIMAGSGVASENIPSFLSSKIDAVHFTVGAFPESLALGMGARLISDAQKVEAIMKFKA